MDTNTMADGQISRPKEVVSVWWNLDKCPVPTGIHPAWISKNISSALESCILDPHIFIRAYGNVDMLPDPVQVAFYSTAIQLHPSTDRVNPDKQILVDMLLWAVDNPPPSNIVLISGDRYFSSALHGLSRSNYTIHLAVPLNAPEPLPIAKFVWDWHTLLGGGRPHDRGNSLTASTFENENLLKSVYHVLPNHFPLSVWVRIDEFLLSTSGRMAIFNSSNRFEAAQILKRDCLQEFLLDDLHKLFDIITMKKLIQCGGQKLDSMWWSEAQDLGH